VYLLLHEYNMRLQPTFISLYKELRGSSLIGPWFIIGSIGKLKLKRKLPPLQSLRKGLSKTLTKNGYYLNSPGT
jgi:hypothetical protein